MDQDQGKKKPIQLEVVGGGDGDVNNIMEPPKPKTTVFMMVFSLYIALAGWIYNFDLGYGGIVLIMKPFLADFGTCISKQNAAHKAITSCSLTAVQQSLVSLTFLFVALGGALSGLTGAYFGRRGSIQIGCIIVAAGAGGMLGTSHNYAAYIVCKCLGGIGLGLFIATAPAYSIECTTASKRGILSSLFNLGLGVGNAVAAAVCLSTSNYTSSIAWQTPIICQIPLSFMLGVGVMMFPESPRWLLVNGKEEAARKSFARFHASDPNGPEVTRQVQEVQYYIELERTSGSTMTWTEIFNSNNVRRTLTSLLIVIGQAVSGGKFISTYATIFLSAVGVSSPFVITAIVASCAVFGGLFSPVILDYGGRRFSLVVGYSIMAASMLVIAAVSTGLGPASGAAKHVLIVFLCLWSAVYAGFIGPSISTIAPEMHSVRLRTYGQACSVLVYETFSFAAAFYTPYMLNVHNGNMGTNVGYFYFGVTLIILTLVVLWVPETARLSLEQIDDYFMSGTKAWSTSTGNNKKIATMWATDYAGEKEP